MLLAGNCFITEERLLEIIDDIVMLGHFNKCLWEKKNVIFDLRFIEKLSKLYDKRKNDCITLEELCSLLNNKCRLKLNKCPLEVVRNHQSKVKKSKEKKSISIDNQQTMFKKFIGLTENQIKELFKKFEHKFINKYIFMLVLDKIHTRTKKPGEYGLNWFKKSLNNFNPAEEGMLEQIRKAHTEGLKKVKAAIG